MGDKIVAVDGGTLNFKRFVDVVGTDNTLKLRVARLRAASGGGKSAKSQVRRPASGPAAWPRRPRVSVPRARGAVQIWRAYSSRDDKTTLSSGDGRDLVSLCPMLGVV